MNRKAINTTLLLCLVITMLLSIPVFAAPSITLNKTEFTPYENAEAKISGVSAQLIEEDAWVGLAAEDTKYENTDLHEYISNLSMGNVWKFTVPNKFGKYEVRVLDSDYNLIAKTSFTIGATKAKPGDIKMSKTEAKLREPISVTVNGLTKDQIEDDAWLGISKYNEKIENTIHYEYVSNLDINNTYKFEAPNSFGKYEVRVFSSYNNDEESSFFGKAEFLVVSSKAKPGDIVLSKTSVRPNEAMSATIKGLTKGEIEEGAWLGVAKYDEKLYNTYYNEYISNLKMGDIYEFTAPDTPGKYELRVFCAYNLKEEEFEYGMFGKAEFIVSGSAAPSSVYKEGYEGLHSWHVAEINTAVQENLVTDKVLTDFPKEITREEFCELAVLLYEKMIGKKTAAAVNPFSDTKNPEVLKAYNLGIVGGVGEGKFAPNNKVTRQEISAMLVRTLKAVKPGINTKADFKIKFQDERDVAAWAFEDIKFMNANEVINGSVVNGVSYINPKGNTTREQSIALVLRIYNQFK